MPLHVSFQAAYAGRNDDGHVLYDIIIKVLPEGIGVIQGVPQPEILSGNELRTEFIVPTDTAGQPVLKKRQDASPARVRRSVTNQERRTAEGLGGYRQTGSGARRGYKGDGRVEGRYRIENKMTRASSTVVRLSDLQKIRGECSTGEVPIFEVEFRERGTLRPLDKWALVPWDAWERLANAADDDI
jgi:hypothetical protein